MIVFKLNFNYFSFQNMKLSLYKTQFDISMIQQKKINTNNSLNYLNENFKLEDDRNRTKQKKIQNQPKKRLSIAQTSNKNIMNSSVNKQVYDIRQKKQVSKNKKLQNQTQDSKQKLLDQNKKIRRKTSKQHHMNVSSSAIVLSQTRDQHKSLNSKQKRESPLKAYAQNINIENERKLNQREYKDKVQNNLHKNKLKGQTQKLRENSTKISLFSHTKNKKSQRLQQYQKKKHLSCASILEGIRKSKSNSKSKSKSKSKDKKKGNKKHSYKFNKISINHCSNKQNQIHNQKNPLISMQKQFKSITKKMSKEVQLKHKNSGKRGSKDFLFHVDKKKSKNQMNKQNKDPVKNIQRFTENINRTSDLYEDPQLLIKKQPLHMHRKFSQKFQLDLNLKHNKKNKQKNESDDRYFLIRKNDTPSSSRKEFPINKYFQASKIKQCRQKQQLQKSKKHSFQKTVKPQKKRFSLIEKDIPSHRSYSQDHNSLKAVSNQNRNQLATKNKRKKSQKQQHETNLPRFNLVDDSAVNKNIIQKKRGSFTEQELIYRQQSSELVEKVDINKTPKQKRLLEGDLKETVMRQKRQYESNQSNESKIASQKKSHQVNIMQNAQNSQDTFLFYGSESFNQSINIDQIRYYESVSPSNQNNAVSPYVQLQDTKLKETENYENEVRIFGQHFKNRAKIMHEFKEEYPLLTKKELEFLASICFIQRKWKQIALAKKIKQLICTQNTSELFTKNKVSFFKPNMLNQDKNSSHLMTSAIISKSQLKNLTTQSQNTQTQEFVSIETQEKLNQLFTKKQTLELPQKTKEEAKPIIQSRQKQQIIQRTCEVKDEKKDTVCYSNIQEQDIFPDLSYIKTKKYLQKQKYLKNLQHLNFEFKTNRLGSEEYMAKKQSLQNNYKAELHKLKQTRKSIKKGYLKYLQTIEVVNKSLIKDKILEEKKSIKKEKQKSRQLLKRVNSEDGIIGDIYRKIFKLQQLISDNGSEASAQTKNLNELFLIRKINHQKDLNVEKGIFKRSGNFKGIGKNLGFDQNGIHTERAIEKIKTEENQAFKVSSLSHRQAKSMQLAETELDELSKQQRIIFEEDDFELIKVNEQLIGEPLCSKEKKSEKIELKTQNLEVLNKQLKVDRTQAFNISELILSHEQRNRLKEIAEKEGSSDRNKCIDQVKIRSTLEEFPESMGSPRPNIDLGQLDDQIQNLYYPFQNPNHDLEQYNQPLPTNVSPISSSMTLSTGVNAEGKEYLQKFVQFILSNEQYLHELTQTLNMQQGFRPHDYLRFVRQFELPQQQYHPVIDLRIFLQFEQQVILSEQQSISSHQGLFQHSWFAYSTSQYKQLEHKCLYELLNSQLQHRRVYGQKGKPFPWQINYTTFEPTEIKPDQVPTILGASLAKCLENTLSFSCGIILENHPDVLNQDDLEELHDRNQDEIIDMIEHELVEEKHSWYEVEQHKLQTLFEASELVWNQLMHQLALDIQNMNRHKLELALTKNMLTS